MTLRAEDFNLKATGSQKKAEEYVGLMNEAVEVKNYPLYKQGFQKLINEVSDKMPQLKGPMDYKLLAFDMVARFINEVQEVELGFEDKWFSTRIGIGTLFLNPTLEVISTVTGEVLATFENVDCFKLTKFNRAKLEAVQDKRINNENRRLFLMERIKRANSLIDNPEKIFHSAYNDFLVDPQKNEEGVLNKVFATISKLQQSKYYLSVEGKQSLRDELSSMQNELAEIHVELDAYSVELREVDWLKREFGEFQSPFQRLMQQYNLLDAKSYYEEQNELQQVK